MPSSYSANLKIELQATGENAGTWGTITNTNLGTALEQAIVGYAAATFPADADLTLTYADTNAAQTARALVLTTNSSVSLSTTRNLIVPAIQKQYVVQNGTTGGQSIVVKTPTGTGITVPNGRKAHLYVDGTNVVVMDDYIPAGSNNSYAIAPNLLVGTTTNFTSTWTAGGTALAGYGIYPYTTFSTTTPSGTVNTASRTTLTAQNTSFPIDGATSITLASAVFRPLGSNSGAGGTGTLTLQGVSGAPSVTSSGINARMTLLGGGFSAARVSSSDLSTSSSNAQYGITATAGIEGTVGAGASSAAIVAASISAYSGSGTTTTLDGVFSGTSIGNAATDQNATVTNVSAYRTFLTVGLASGANTSSVTNAYSFNINSVNIRTGTTVTNYYAFFANTPTVTGTLTNRWGIYIADPSSPNYFAGSIRVGAGTVAAPTLTTIADTNTGIFFPAADNVSVVTGGAERMRINSSGNVGFGYPAQTWGSGALALQLGQGYDSGSIVADAPNGVFNVVHNARWDGTDWIYNNSAAVSRYFTDRGNGAHVFQTAPVGTQFTTVTLSERLRIKQTGQVRFFPLAAAPSGAENGDVYYDSTTNKLRVYAGGVWTDLH